MIGLRTQTWTRQIQRRRAPTRGALGARRARRRRARRGRRGLSLLEVMLAIAILGGTMAVLGELVRTGTTAALRCQEVTTGQMLCENLLNEVVIGMRPMTDDQGIYPDYPEWSYSLTIQPSDQVGLLVLIATVGHQDGSTNPYTMQMFRWAIDPVLKYPPEEEEEELMEGSIDGA